MTASATPNRPRNEPSTTESGSFTAAGLPRRSSRATTIPALPEVDDNVEQTDDGDQGETKAERIRTDLEGFLEGQRAATKDE
ncbi:hypothetical protein DEF28_14155 [Marinitenerispora sediminis]|nr:hypothetical protein DEF28_14155 [Marinitenerispora sediminis]